MSARASRTPHVWHASHPPILGETPSLFPLLPCRPSSSPLPPWKSGVAAARTAPADAAGTQGTNTTSCGGFPLSFVSAYCLASACCASPSSRGAIAVSDSLPASSFFWPPCWNAAATVLLWCRACLCTAPLIVHLSWCLAALPPSYVPPSKDAPCLPASPTRRSCGASRAPRPTRGRSCCCSSGPCRPMRSPRASNWRKRWRCGPATARPPLRSMATFRAGWCPAAPQGYQPTSPI